MKKTVKLGIIGLGQRGDVMLDNPIIPMLSDGLEVVAVCDRLARPVRSPPLTTESCWRCRSWMRCMSPFRGRITSRSRWRR